MSTLSEAQPLQYCAVFEIWFEPAHLPPKSNSVACVHAREMVDQYNLSGRDVQQIGFKLAPGFTREMNSGEDCRVDKELLFQVLDEVSAL